MKRLCLGRFDRMLAGKLVEMWSILTLANRCVYVPGLQYVRRKYYQKLAKMWRVITGEIWHRKKKQSFCLICVFCWRDHGNVSETHFPQVRSRVEPKRSEAVKSKIPSGSC